VEDVELNYKNNHLFTFYVNKHTGILASKQLTTSLKSVKVSEGKLQGPPKTKQNPINNKYNLTISKKPLFIPKVKINQITKKLLSKNYIIKNSL
jgi:hypothetical protein